MFIEAVTPMAPPIGGSCSVSSKPTTRRDAYPAPWVDRRATN